MPALHGPGREHLAKFECCDGRLSPLRPGCLHSWLDGAPLAGFPRAPFMCSKAAVTLHTPLDLRGNIPRFIDITHRRWNDVRVLDEPIPEAGAFTVMDRGKSFQKKSEPMATFMTLGKPTNWMTSGRHYV